VREEKGMKASRNKGLSRKFGPKAEKVINRLHEFANIRALLIVLIAYYYRHEQIKVDETSGTCSMHTRMSPKKYLNEFLLNLVSGVYSGVEYEAMQLMLVSTVWISI
jgi:hypothetical protein